MARVLKLCVKSWTKLVAEELLASADQEDCKTGDARGEKGVTMFTDGLDTSALQWVRKVSFCPAVSDDVFPGIEHTLQS